MTRNAPRGPALARAGARRAALLRWFGRKARPLPWRLTKSAYPVWVSEIMLQQTQVATVIRYYQRFLRTFPTLRSLAASSLERVLEVWSGLGYYRRARHLHRAAQIVVERFGGHFPRDYAAVRSLPGVGDYTARAVLSIAYRLPYAVLDGNVARVIARLDGVRGIPGQARFRSAIEQTLSLTFSRRQPGNFNQALMELGQTICLPRAPRCPQCPLRKWCTAYRLRCPESFPSPRRRQRAVRRHLALGALADRQGRIALVRGLDEGLLEDLWNFPSAFGPTSGEAKNRLEQMLGEQAGRRLEFGLPVARLSHRITFRSIEAEVYATDSFRRMSLRGACWCRLESLPKKAVSQLARKIAAQLASKVR